MDTEKKIYLKKKVCPICKGTERVVLRREVAGSEDKDGFVYFCESCGVCCQHPSSAVTYMADGIKNVTEVKTVAERTLDETMNGFKNRAGSASAREIASGSLDGYLADIRKQYARVESLAELLSNLNMLLEKMACEDA